MDALEGVTERTFRSVPHFSGHSGDRLASAQSVACHLHAPAQKIVERRRAHLLLEISGENRPGHTDGTCKFVDGPAIGDVAVHEVEGGSYLGVGCSANPAGDTAAMPGDEATEHLDQENVGDALRYQRGTHLP